ncbi:aromatic acid exporter family protein [Dethiobacter alkaliphilus]|uniref:aromatic acid exporter family protein n=1 Tax=Dethiobacter alkaliphilus TaxID=427926 RepID=UPI002226765D|nr:aromatic acid exporter family protein [Dethiobacter alkaliphilus]MCW3489551.1 aromatic acid exporter family protein [Dethiobacter alkaliphilus]
MPNKFYVGGRIIKTALAVGLSIFIVQSLGFERVTLAAIVAMVTTQRTFYRSIVRSAARLGSVLLGAVLGTLFGLMLGNSPLAFGVVTIFVILSCLRLNWQDNILITAVVAIGIMSSEAASLPMYSVEQFLSALIGAVVALGINFLFAPHHQDDVKTKLREIELSLSVMMNDVAREMLNTGKAAEDFELRAADIKREIKIGLELSKLFQEEQKFSLTKETQADRYRDALRKFSSQAERLVEMHNLAIRMEDDVPQARPIARLLRLLRRVQVRRLTGRTIHNKLLDKLIINLEAEFKEMELPKTRAEFISRSSLVHLFKEIKKYYRRTGELPPVLQEEANIKRKLKKLKERGRERQK